MNPRRMEYWTNGDIPPPSEGEYVYVVRPCDLMIWERVTNAENGKIPVLYGARQSGKTSLLIRLVDRAKGSHKVVRVDVDVVFKGDISGYQTELSILDEFLEVIAEKAGCHGDFLQWRDHLAKQKALAATNVHERFRRFMEEVLAASTSDPMLLLLDEFDYFRSFGSRWRFLLRCFYKHSRSPIAKRIRFVVAGLLRPTDHVARRDNSKWKMFDFHWIGDFDARDPEVLRTLARGLRNPPGPDEERATALVLEASGGQPYLSVNLLQKLAGMGAWKAKDVEDVIVAYVASNRQNSMRRLGEPDLHFNYAATYLHNSDEWALPALAAYRKLLSGDRSFHLPAEVENTLLGAGLVSLDGGVRTKSRIVREIFDETWIADQNTRLLDAQADQKIKAAKSSTARRSSPALPRVVILNIGGTLGMDYGPDDKALDPATPDRFLSDVPEIYDLVSPIVERPFPPRDGANIAPPQWRLLADKINSYRDSGVVGVVVMTGTDTMAYSASAVAFALGKTLKFPVAFVGAQARRKRMFADSSPNLLRALEVAKQGPDLAQVVIVFNDQIFRAVRADKKDDFRYDGFWAPTEGPLAVFVEEIKYQVDPESLREAYGDAGIEPRIDFEERILTISQRPGLNPDLYLPLLDPERVKGVFIESLGVGNLPTVEDYSFERLIKTAISKAIPVLIASRYPVQPELAAFYAPATEFLKLAEQGVMSASDMVPPAATVKFMWAIAEIRRRYEKRQVDDATRLRALEDLMSTNLVGEIRRKDLSRRS